LRVNPLAAKFCTKTKTKTKTKPKTKRTTFLGRMCYWIKKKETNSKFVSMNNMPHDKSIPGSRHK